MSALTNNLISMWQNQELRPLFFSRHCSAAFATSADVDNTGGGDDLSDAGYKQFWVRSDLRLQCPCGLVEQRLLACFQVADTVQH